jgi:hypothetical protein
LKRRGVYRPGAKVAKGRGGGRVKFEALNLKFEIRNEEGEEEGRVRSYLLLGKRKKKRFFFFVSNLEFKI